MHGAAREPSKTLQTPADGETEEEASTRMGAVPTSGSEWRGCTPISNLLCNANAEGSCRRASTHAAADTTCALHPTGPAGVEARYLGASPAPSPIRATPLACGLAQDGRPASCARREGKLGHGERRVSSERGVAGGRLAEKAAWRGEPASAPEPLRVPCGLSSSMCCDWQCDGAVVERPKHGI